ncbi:MAG TPA: hypothetical protein VLL76_02640, partial [Candidatus Omnitrophota bacterium]|nr:hypothetical protein [Candidatus Omnitrophota bacterium]
WHMSMTHFFTTYLYNPMVVGLTRRRAAKGLGTSPKDLSRPGAFVMVTALPTLATMVVMGMWHGNNVMFALFGLLHGVYLVLNRGWRAVQKRYGFKWGKSRPAFLASWLLTFLAVTAAWAVFRSPDLAAAAKVVPALFGANGFYLPESYGLRLGAVAQVLTALGIRFEAPVDILIYPSVAHLWKLAVLVGVALALPNSQQWLARFAPALNPVASAPRRQWSPGLSTGMLTAVVFVICLVLVHVNQQSSFIYFQF